MYSLEVIKSMNNKPKMAEKVELILARKITKLKDQLKEEKKTSAYWKRSYLNVKKILISSDNQSI